MEVDGKDIVADGRAMIEKRELMQLQRTEEWRK